MSVLMGILRNCSGVHKNLGGLMWLFTNTGFVSAVQINGELVVRARDSESLEPLAELAKKNIRHSPESDYPYRVITDHETFSKWVKHMAQNIDYPNFKSEVAQVRGYEFANALTSVWSVMHEVEDDQARTSV